MHRPAAVSLLVVLALTLPLFGGGNTPFQRGDANTDGNFDISDPIRILDGLFGGQPLDCDDAADGNDDGSLNIADVVYLLNFLFGGGTAPAAPFGSCGTDPTSDALGCSSYPLCVPPISHAVDIQPIFNTNCAICHGGPMPAGGMVLAGNAFPNIVGVSSNAVPSMNRITPGDPSNSYLWHKINGTHMSVGGLGAQMPPLGPPLPPATIQLITDWITQGAQP